MVDFLIQVLIDSLPRPVRIAVYSLMGFGLAALFVDEHHHDDQRIVRTLNMRGVRQAAEYAGNGIKVGQSGNVDLWQVHNQSLRL